MDSAQREEIREKISRAIEETEKDITALEELTKPIAPDNAIGRLSRMDAINNRSINQAQLNTSRSKLIMLKKAMERVDESEFGICADCGEPIPVGRIMIMPEANLCVRCAS
jgi:DnaK suppressor protein